MAYSSRGASMSDPRQQSSNAETIRFGLLAARSSDALGRAAANLPLTDEDREILGKAESFLRDVAEGAAFLTNGTQGGGSAFGATEALGFALQPSQVLDDLVQGREIPEVFVQLADAVHQIIGGRVGQEDVVSSVRAFFDGLYSSLVSVIEHSKLRPLGRSSVLGHYA